MMVSAAVSGDFFLCALVRFLGWTRRTGTDDSPSPHWMGDFSAPVIHSAEWCGSGLQTHADFFLVQRLEEITVRDERGGHFADLLWRSAWTLWIWRSCKEGGESKFNTSTDILETGRFYVAQIISHIWTAHFQWMISIKSSSFINHSVLLQEKYIAHF